jgi:hypothetical protein
MNNTTIPPHGKTWNDVRSVPATDLEVGDQLVTSGTGTAYREARDGTVRGIGWQPLDGLLWTITAREDGKITGRSHTGLTDTAAPRGKVLKVIAT